MPLASPSSCILCCLPSAICPPGPLPLPVPALPTTCPPMHAPVASCPVLSHLSALPSHPSPLKCLIPGAIALAPALAQGTTHSGSGLSQVAEVAAAPASLPLCGLTHAPFQAALHYLPCTPPPCTTWSPQVVPSVLHSLPKVGARATAAICPGRT